MKKVLFITVTALVFILAFKLGRFRYSSEYFIVRDIPYDRITRIDCRFWKFNGGTLPGGHYDLLDFNKGICTISGNKLYIEGLPIAHVVSLVRRISDYELTVTGLDNGEICYFVSK